MENLLSPFGIDVADCNGPVILNKAGAPALKFVGARVGIGYWYKDVQYAHTKAQADALAIPTIAYHVLIPGSPLASQISSFKSWAGKPGAAWGVAWDLEVTNGQTPGKISLDTKTVIQAMLDAGYNVINYSSPGWIDEYFRNPVTNLLPDWVIANRWWFAQYYSNGVERFTLDVPKGMSDSQILIHQTNSQAPNLYGSIYDSQDMDTDRWRIGTVPVIGSVPAPITPAPTPVISVFHVVNCNGLYVHSKPNSLESTRTGLLLRGAQVNGATKIVVDGNIWWLQAEGGYVAQTYNGNTYLA